ncbi:MAG TPA: hypothetical protein H9782_11410 [Candidatus Bariatricus faecipullorum]|nr:hypothetical protein [Candidatus Bariatricus faecipullorum]
MRSFRSLTREDYAEVKSRLSMEKVAEFYGYQVKRGGVCLCPFHNDIHPSMKIYPDDRGFYCWVCGKGGDVIRFTALLFGLTDREACRKLAEDFSIPVTHEGETYRERRERQKRQERHEQLQKFRKEAEKILSGYRILLCEAARDPSSAHFVEALQELSVVEYRLECLRENPAEYYADRKAVRKLGEIQKRTAGWNK